MKCHERSCIEHSAASTQLGRKHDSYLLQMFASSFVLSAGSSSCLAIPLRDAHSVQTPTSSLTTPAFQPIVADSIDESSTTASTSLPFATASPSSSDAVGGSNIASGLSPIAAAPIAMVDDEASLVASPAPSIASAPHLPVASLTAPGVVTGSNAVDTGAQTQVAISCIKLNAPA